MGERRLLGNGVTASGRWGVGRCMYQAALLSALLGAFLAVAILASGEARAHGQCMPFMAWLDVLEQSHGEMLLDGGMNRLPIAYTENDKTGTWTLLRLSPDGMACMIAEGTKKVVVASDPPA